jgi:sulfur-oxidizing protein SoxY
MQAMSRREALRLGAGTAAAAMFGPGALATPQEADAAIAAFTGGRMPEAGEIVIDLPAVAEDGNAVPLSISVASPMRPDDFIAEILVVADGNPRPRVATFHFGAMSGRAEATTRIRLAQSQNVIVIAKTGDGRVLTARRHVAVIIGGCTG